MLHNYLNIVYKVTIVEYLLQLLQFGNPSHQISVREPIDSGEIFCNILGNVSASVAKG